jgi:hypothetical protein
MGDVPLHVVDPGEEGLARVRAVLDGLPDDLDHEPEPLDDILAFLRSSVERRYAEEASDPDYDVAPIFHIEGRGGLVPVMATFADDEEKAHVFRRLVPTVMEGVRASVWALAHPIWRVTGEAGGPMPGEPGFLQPRERPDRQEAINVHGCDLRRYVAWHAVVDRTPKGVRVGAWEKMWDVEDWTSVHGDIIDPLNEELIRARIAYTCRRLVLEGGLPEEFWTPERLAARAAIDARLDTVRSRADVRSLAEREGSLLMPLMVELGLFEEVGGRVVPSDLLLEEADLAQIKGLWGERDAAGDG